jgi:hypothetical protein
MKLWHVSKAIFRYIFLKRKKSPGSSEGHNGNLKFDEEVTFWQVFFLYILYKWVLEKPQESVIKNQLDSIIAINYYLLKEKYKFPDIGNFENKNGSPKNPIVESMYIDKEKEKMISENNLEYNLVEKGKRVTEIVIRGNHYNYHFFHKSIKHFNQDMINEINENIVKLKQLSDNSLISTCLSLL